MSEMLIDIRISEHPKNMEIFDMSEKEWSLYETKEEKEFFLEPLKFSNGKTQQNVVDEVLREIKKGKKVIFIHGVCGTGKSAIALNIAKELGRASVVVPVKSLQKQYEEDYTNRKYVLKNGKKLLISLITGRKNHSCPFLDENPDTVKIEKNSTLDIFDFGLLEKKGENSCDNSQIPCKIEIKMKNMDKIRSYLKLNPRIKQDAFASIIGVRRMSIAPVCKYWSPIIPEGIEISALDDVKKIKYAGLNDINFNIYQRKKGCGYCDQFNAYINSDVIIFNSPKYLLESVMDRKPATNVEIIDECDEFLDSFSNLKKINMNLLNSALINVYSFDADSEQTIQKVWKLKDFILKDKDIEKHIENDEIIPLKDSKVYELLKLFLDSSFINSVELDEENYCYQVDEVARTFKDFFEESYVLYSKDDKDLIVRIVTTNLEKRFKELVDKNKALVLMSGTIHSEKVLRDIFGLTEFKIIDAETEMPGKITLVKTGKEVNCKYTNFQQGLVSREQYLIALSESIDKAVKPALVHVNSFADLPSEGELRMYGLNIMSREKLKETQYLDKVGKAIEDFKKGKIEVLYSTKANRGVDFPGEVCNSIILTKYPYPSVRGLFWRVLRKTRPQHYNEFYLDKSRREFLQRLYRGLRSKNDHIYLLSPDSRVFENLNLWRTSPAACGACSIISAFQKSEISDNHQKTEVF